MYWRGYNDNNIPTSFIGASPIQKLWQNVAVRDSLSSDHHATMQGLQGRTV